MLARIRPRTGADGGSAESLGERGDDRDRPRLVGEPQGRLEPPLVEQGFDQLVLVPGAEPPDRLTNRPAGEGVGIVEGLVELRYGAAAASPSRPSAIAASRRTAAIAIVEKLCQIVRDVAIAANARRSSRLKPDPGGWVAHHGGDRLSCFGAADRVERPEGV